MRTIQKSDNCLLPIYHWISMLECCLYTYIYLDARKAFPKQCARLTIYPFTSSPKSEKGALQLLIIDVFWHALVDTHKLHHIWLDRHTDLVFDQLQHCTLCCVPLVALYSTSQVWERKQIDLKSISLWKLGCWLGSTTCLSVLAARHCFVWTGMGLGTTA